MEALLAFSEKYFFTVNDVSRYVNMTFKYTTHLMVMRSQHSFKRKNIPPISFYCSKELMKLLIAIKLYIQILNVKYKVKTRHKNNEWINSTQGLTENNVNSML